MELRHLKYFVAVAEELHFRKAAERLHITQPALSTQIKRLEKELGVQLLQRSNRSVQLTDAGRAFLEEARLSLGHSVCAIQNARRVGSGEIGHVHVGIVGSATYSVLTELISLFRERFPEVWLTPREMNTVPQAEALRAEQLDIGFLRPSSDYDIEDLEVETFFEEPLIAVLPTSHPLANRRQIELGVLSEVPFVLAASEREPGMNEEVLDACERVGFVPEVAEETTELPVALGLIAAGVGVTLLPASVGKVKTPEVAYRRLAKPVPSTKLSVAWNPASVSPAALRFLNFARDFAYRQVPSKDARQSSVR